MPHCNLSTTIPHGVRWNWTWGSAVRNRRLTPWTVVRPLLYMLMRVVSAVRLHVGRGCEGQSNLNLITTHLNCCDAQASVGQEVMLLHSQAMRLAVFRAEYVVNQNRPLDGRPLFCESGKRSFVPADCWLSPCIVFWGYSRSAVQEISRLLWNTNVHYRVEKRPQLDPILSQQIAVHILKPFSTYYYISIYALVF